MVTLGLIGILFGLALLIWLSYRGWSVLLLAPLAAMITTSRGTCTLKQRCTRAPFKGIARDINEKVRKKVECALHI
jgi:hypothetical protein